MNISISNLSNAHGRGDSISQKLCDTLSRSSCHGLPGILAPSPQPRSLQGSLQVLFPMLQSGNLLKGNKLKKPFQISLVCSPFIRNHCPSMPDVLWMLKTVDIYVIQTFVCLFLLEGKFWPLLLYLG